MNFKDLIKENNTTLYKLCKASDINISQHNRVQKALQGEKSVALETVTKLCAGMTKLAGKPVTLEDIDFDIVTVKLK